MVFFKIRTRHEYFVKLMSRNSKFPLLSLELAPQLANSQTYSGHFPVLSFSFSTLRVAVCGLVCTVHKTDLILRSKDRKPNIQFSMANKFKLQPLRRYDVKHTEKTAGTLSYV